MSEQTAPVPTEIRTVEFYGDEITGVRRFRTKRVFAIISIFVLAIVLSLSSFLVAGSQGWTPLPTFGIVARPVVISMGKHKTSLLKEQSSRWLLDIWYKDWQLRMHKTRLLSIAVPDFEPSNQDAGTMIVLW